MYVKKVQLIDLSCYFLNQVLPRGAGEKVAQKLLIQSFEDAFEDAKREYAVTNGRIDFRIGGPNPVAIEIAVRTERGRNVLYGSQNEAELKKLARMPQSRAKMRYLLLLDNCEPPMDADDLRRTYDNVTPHSLGLASVSPVCVVYVNRHGCDDFLWH